MYEELLKRNIILEKSKTISSNGTSSIAYEGEEEEEKEDKGGEIKC